MNKINEMNASPILTTQHVERPTRRPLKILFIKKNSGNFLGFLTLIPKIKHWGKLKLPQREENSSLKSSLKNYCFLNNVLNIILSIIVNKVGLISLKLYSYPS